MASTEQRIVEGYHGTHDDAVDRILRDGFEVSRNPYDWLGDGVYFWEYGRQRAWDWARGKWGASAAVIGARITLVDCFDLLDTQWCRVLADSYNGFLEHWKRLGLDLPRQTSGAHRLDREVINYILPELRDRDIVIKCVRGLFKEGRPVYPDSAILDLNHIQIAVIDQAACILEKWRDAPPEGGGE